MSLGPAYGVGTPSGIPGVDVDLFNDALVVVSELHHQIHEGVAFHISTANFGDWDSLGSGNEHYDVLFVTGDNVCHLRAEIVAGVQGRFRLFEAVTTSDDGTEVPSRNFNRISSKVPTSKAYLGAVVTDFGVTLTDQLLNGGDTSAATGTSETSREWLLPANTKYLLRATNQTSGQNNESVGLEMHFYEPALET